MTTPSQPPIWAPTTARIQAANLTRFIALVNERHRLDLVDYESLYLWSCDQPEAFWPLLWEFADVRASRGWDRVLTHADAMPGARWFEGARLNFAENLLRRNDQAPALIFRCENGERLELSHAELSAQVASLAAWLRAKGIEPGDRVAALMPNRPETIALMLAAASVGALFSSASPDFGVDGVVDRFGQITPRVLLAVDGYHYAGKRIDIRAKVAESAARIPGLERLLLVPWLESDPEIESDLPVTRWSRALAQHAGSAHDFAQLPFDHPLYVLFSSGTTGKPKCIVHGAGGTLLQHLKEHRLHTDIKPDDRLFYFTTCGWMMWNWLASGLASGATLVLFDGSPFHPGPEVLWDLAEAEDVRVFGTSAKYIAAIEKAGLRPREGRTLAKLDTLLSTGSPLAPESYDYVYSSVGDDLLLGSISGGTDIVSCFALASPLKPVYRGELQCRGLGLAVAVLDDDGQPLIGERGELVCTKPFPCMPVGFWNDPDGERYHAAYFERFDGIWTHGDFAELTEHGGLIIHGRSDAVLNPGGVRIGTAEIYRVVDGLDEVLESIAVGQEVDDDQRVVLFVVLREGLSLDEDLTRHIRTSIRARLSPRHMPAKVLQVPEIPRTRSGKIVELAVRETIHGRPVKNVEALANPEALRHFADRRELAD